MIQTSIIYGIVAAFAIAGCYRWRIALFGVIVMTALHDHAFFRDAIGGIVGLKAYNILFLCVLVQWISQRVVEGQRWDATPRMTVGLILYTAVVVYGPVVAMIDFDQLAANGWTLGHFALDNLFNPLKFLLVGIMVFDGCRTPQRMGIALIAVCGLACITAVYICKIIPISSLLDPSSVLNYRLRIEKQLGLHPNDAINILVPGFWAALALFTCLKRWSYKLLSSVVCGLTLLATLLTQSRTGMGAFVIVGFVLALLRVRALALLLLILVPTAYFGLSSVSANWSRGFDVERVDGSVSTDLTEVTNGRVELWQEAWHDIQYAPVLGQGAYASARHPFGLLRLESHPHNAYLHIWLEDGVFGLLIIVITFLAIMFMALRVMVRAPTHLGRSVGLCGFAAVLTNFVIALVGHGFMPRLSMVISYCLIALTLRVHLVMTAVDAPLIGRRPMRHSTIPGYAAPARMRPV